MYGEGLDIDEIAERTGLTRFQVRAEVNRLEPPDHGRAFLLPNTSGHDTNIDGAILDVRIDPKTNRRPVDIVANLAKRSKDAPPRQRGAVKHGTVAGYSRHRRAQQDPCQSCKDAMAAYYRAKRKGKSA